LKKYNGASNISSYQKLRARSN